jgi:hypothetical protein
MADETDNRGQSVRVSWDATSHLGYREWASAALGDERQVYARSTTSAAESLFFLPDGAAEQFRNAARRAELVCPVPGCPSPLITTRGPESRRHHFVHLQAPADSEHQRIYVRRVATEIIADWVSAAHPRSTVETNATVAGQTIAVLVTGPGGERFAVMFIDRRLGVDAWRNSDYALERAGLVRGWIFAPRQFLRYPQPSPDAGADDPAVIDRERGDIVLDRALLREMRAEGRWPLLINIDRREVANLIAPHGEVARRLSLQPPASGDRVLHLVVSALADCRLCRDGIETPAVGRNVLAARRLAREQRDRHEAALERRATLDNQPTFGHQAAPSCSEAVSRPEKHLFAASGKVTESRILDALNASHGSITVEALRTTLELSRDAEGKLLREVLYYLRVGHVIDFEGPLGPSTTIQARHASL